MYTREEVEKMVEAKGLILGKDYKTLTSRCTCKCKECGWKVLNVRVYNVKIRKSMFSCLGCNNEKLKNLLSSRGMTMIKIEKRTKVSSLVDYMCKCGNEYYLTPSSIEESVKNPQEFSLCKGCKEKDIRDALAERGCRYVEGTYTDSKKLVQYFCVCGDRCFQRSDSILEGANG